MWGQSVWSARGPGGPGPGTLPEPGSEVPACSREAAALLLAERPPGSCRLLRRHRPAALPPVSPTLRATRGHDVQSVTDEPRKEVHLD